MTGYTEIIRKYATDNSHAGFLQQADGTGEVGLSSSDVGRKLAVRFPLQMSQDKIKRARYQVFGCGFTVAACAATAELIEGKTLNELSRVNATAIDQRLGGLPDERGYCADLAVEALQAAVSSVQQKSVQVEKTIDPHQEENHSRVTSADPIYRALINSPAPTACKPADRHLFACLIAIASQESSPLHAALGLNEQVLGEIFDLAFPVIDRVALFGAPTRQTVATLPINPDLQAVVSSYIATNSSSNRLLMAEALANIIVARAAHSGHLWIAMGLFERSQLTAAIGRHLPLLLNANNKGMRWKRFLFKQICEQQGGLMCKSPECGDCSDYRLCFAD